MWKEALGVDLPDFARLPYEESMNRFGVDKPDLRFGMELHRSVERVRRRPK